MTLSSKLTHCRIQLLNSINEPRCIMLSDYLKTLASTLLVVTSVVMADAPLPDPLAAGWQGKKVCEKLHEDTKQRVLRCTFPPGVGHEKHFHAPHVGYTLAGGKVRITSSSGTREVTIKTGDTHSSPNGTEWHEIINIGNTTIIYLLFEVK